jgi:hypothetical protein
VLRSSAFTAAFEPSSQAFVAKQHKLRAVVKEVIKDRMEKQQYDPVKGAQASGSPSGIVRGRGLVHADAGPHRIHCSYQP